MTNLSVTIQDVARRAGVSVTTVSSALNNSGRVADKTRDKVLKAARELGYVASLSARSLKGGRTNVVGVVLGELRSPVFAELAASASDAARAAGMDTLLYTTNYDRVRERNSVASLIDGLVDGLLIMLPKESEHDLELLSRSRVPVVLVNYHAPDPNVTVVGGDNYHGARAAVRHLIALGHRRVAFISGNADSGQSPERQRGYHDELVNAGLSPDPALVRGGDWSEQGGYRETSALLDLPDPPTAVFTANDHTAFGAINAVKARGLRVPEDLSVIGFDDIPSSQHIDPPLTTVRHPFGDIAQVAVKHLLDLIDGKAGPRQRIELPSDLIVRASTGPAPTRPDRPDRPHLGGSV